MGRTGESSGDLARFLPAGASAVVGAGVPSTATSTSSEGTTPRRAGARFFAWGDEGLTEIISAAPARATSTAVDMLALLARVVDVRSQWFK